MTAIALHWFRSDLRIHDNPSLFQTSRHEQSIAVYCLAEEQWELHDVSPAKRSLIIRTLRILAEDLESYNIPLIILPTQNFNTLPLDLLQLCLKYKVTHVFSNEEYEVNEIKCAKNLETLCKKNNIIWQSFHDQCLVQPGKILNQSQEMFKVFTAFKKALYKNIHLYKRPLAQKPNRKNTIPCKSNLKALETVALNPRWEKLWPAGEAEAHKRLHNFIKHKASCYGAQRDHPSVDGTSTLSPYLTVGSLTSSQCVHEVQRLFENVFANDNSSGAAIWVNELVWREFYRHLLHAHPDLCRHKAFIVKTEKLAWKQDEKLFAAWCKGETGYPIVDAAMRQLLTWGWMHNRLRMIVAMFLTKHFFIDWRKGEKFFMQHLVDGDLASNNGGWQWSASTGVDAQPWFRIFNPVRQSQRFDEEGKFIRAYIPKLKELDNNAIHMPSPLEARLCDYPLPIVDHKVATEATKAAFKNLN